MNVCVRCDGEGIETFYDGTFYDARLEHHICYHCNGSGRVSDEAMFHDELYCVAYALASQYVHSLIQAANNDPEGDGFALIAAENGLSQSDYTCHLIELQTEKFGIELVNKSLADQQLLIAWNKLPLQSKKVESNFKQSHFNFNDYQRLENDNIIF